MAARKAEVVITCNASNVKAILEGINRELAKAVQERKQLLEIEKRNGTLTEAEKKRDRELKQTIESLTSAQQKSTQEMRKYGEVMKDLAGSKTKDLKRALGEAKRALDNMSAKDKGRQKLLDDMKLIQQQIDRNTAATKKFGATHNSVWQTAVRNIGAYMGVFAAFNKVKSMVESVFKANLKLSDSLADIRKVSGLTMQEINQLYTNISKIDTRNSVETLNKLAYAGAKLGIGQYGVSGLTGFVKAAEQVQMALGEDLGEDALPALAKLTEVMGIINNYGVEQAMQKTASAIFQLGATSTATGKNIIEFSKRLMGLANVSNVSADELLALGSAADAMGLMPEVAATAFNKLFTSLQKNHNLIEKSLGIDAGTIDKLYQQGKTMDAMVLIFERMKETGNMNSLGGVFKDLGSDGARLVNVMATMADRVDILKKHLKTSTEAFKEGEAVIAEYMIQNETAAALIERASNTWIKAFANPEGVDMVKEMANEWYKLSREMTQNQAIMFQLKTAIQGIALVIETLIKLMPFLIHAFAFAGVLATIRSVYFGITNLITAIRTATTAQMTLNAAMNSNVILAAVSAVAALAAMWYEAAKAEEWAQEQEREHQAELQKAYAKSKEAIEDVVRPLKVYKNALDDANLSEKDKLELTKQFTNDYQDYLDYLGIEIRTVDQLADAYADVVKVMKQKRAYEERENYREQVNGTNKMNRIAAGAEVERELRKMKAGEDVDKAWVMANQNLGTKEMYNAIMRKTYGVGAIEIEGVGKGRWQAPDAKGKWREVTNMALWNAIDDYIGSIRTEKALDKTVNEMFKEDVGNFDLDKWNEERIKNRLKRRGGLTNLKPDKNAEKELAKAQREEKKHLKDEMEQAEKDSTAVINAIEEFYRLQESAIEQLVADGKMTREEADRTINYIRNRKDEMLLEARRAISGKENNFEELRKTMGKDLLRPSDESSVRAMNTVQSINVAEAAKRLQKFNGSKSVYDLDSGSFTQAMLKNAAQNELNIQRRQAKMTEEMDKLLMQYEYVDQAQRSFGDKLVKLGLITEGYDKVVQQLADGTDVVANTKDVQALSEKVIGMDTRIFDVDINDALELKNMIHAIMTTIGKDGKQVRESFASMFPNLDEWMSQPEAFKTQMQAFYRSLLDYDTAYYNARKQNYELYKKQNQQMWAESGREEQYAQIYATLGNRQKMQDVFGTGQSFAQQYGMSDVIAKDPEVELYKQKLQAAAEYYRFVESHQHTEQELREAGQATLEAYLAMAQKVSSEIAERASKIQELQAPATEFAEAIGEKWGDMMFNMESSSDTWNAIVKKMILSFATMTIKMTAENLTKKIQQALFYKQMLAMETEHQAEMLGVQLAFGTMRLQAQQGIDTALQAQKSVNDATTVSKEVSLATILTSLGISEGAAKTIGSLGWWGIPLVAVISSLLMGLLTSALSTAGKSSETTTSSSTSAKKLKLVSNMLTYDEGNVGQYVGDDGHVYQAKATGGIPDGVSLVKSPIATTVNGQPSLVAERGPEIVIGRRATRRIIMNEPALLRHLRTLDEGTIPGLQTENAGAPQQSQSTTLDADTAAALKALPGVMAAFSQMMAGIQQSGIPATVAPFGKGSLDEGMRTVTNFRKKYPD